MSIRVTVSTHHREGLAANFHAHRRGVVRRTRAMVRRNGRAHRTELRLVMPRRTGRMARLLRLRFSPTGLVYEIFWRMADFHASRRQPGERGSKAVPFYPVYLIYGTRNRPGNDFFTPVALRWRRRTTEDMRQIVRQVR